MQSHSLFNFIDSLFFYYDGTLAYLIIQYILVNSDYMSGVLWSAKNQKKKKKHKKIQSCMAGSSQSNVAQEQSR